MTKKKTKIQVDPTLGAEVEAPDGTAKLPLAERVFQRYAVAPGRIEELRAGFRGMLQAIRARELAEPMDGPLGARIETLADDLASAALALEQKTFNVIRAACEPDR